MPSDDPLFIGIDLGTSGCRAIAIDTQGRERAQACVPLPQARKSGPAVEQEPALWWRAVRQVLHALLRLIPAEGVRAIACDGTSGTLFLANPVGRPISPALMYNDARATAEAERIAGTAPRESAAHGAGSGLAKLLWLLARSPSDTPRVHTQADWVTGQLLGRFGVCDVNNALKLGYDPVARQWPDWLFRLGIDPAGLPRIVLPGTPLGTLRAEGLGLPPAVRVVAGTTDSTAAILATGLSRVGEAVTSLGSTLVTKVLASRPLFAPEFGVYSQPLGDAWLVGGGSNSGGAVLRHFFSDEQMARLESRLEPERSTGLDYYPLLTPGERFPVNDPGLPPRIAPRPADDALFFQGLLEGMAQIERQAYGRLAELGAPWPTAIITVGGGARNSAWTAIRARLLGIPVIAARHAEAAYGAALLARGGAEAAIVEEE